MDTSTVVASLKEVQAFKEGRLKLTAKVITPDPIDVVELRESLGKTQEEFASIYGISVSTLRNWEQKRRIPEGVVRTFLALIRKDPKGMAAQVQVLIDETLVESKVKTKRVMSM